MEQAIQPVKRVPEGEISFEEFLAWGDEDTHAEWVKRKVILKVPAITTASAMQRVCAYNGGCMGERL